MAHTCPWGPKPSLVREHRKADAAQIIEKSKCWPWFKGTSTHTNTHTNQRARVIVCPSGPVCSSNGTHWINKEIHVADRFTLPTPLASTLSISLRNEGACLWSKSAYFTHTCPIYVQLLLDGPKWDIHSHKHASTLHTELYCGWDILGSK